MGEADSPLEILLGKTTLLVALRGQKERNIGESGESLGMAN